MSETASHRLARVLALVPHIVRRPGIAINELAAEFDVPREQIAADLDLLMVCGLPGYYPDDLVDVVLDEDGGTVAIAFDAGIERPVRLAPDEVVALTVALRTLADLPALVDADVVHSALAKLETVASGPGDAVQVAAATPAAALGTVRQAIDESRQLWIRYYTASRDAVTERVVDPIRLLVTDGHAYLEGFCHLAQGIRHFRVDRIDEARITEEPAQAPLWVEAEVPEQMFSADPSQPSAVLTLAPGGAWVAEYYANERLAPPPGGGGQRIRLRAGGGDEWLVRLVLSLGADAVLEDRPDLARQVAERARAALAGYDGADSPREDPSTATKIDFPE